MQVGKGDEPFQREFAETYSIHTTTVRRLRRTITLWRHAKVTWGSGVHCEGVIEALVHRVPFAISTRSQYIA